MAWKPKTVLGKILKGAVIAGGSVLAIGSGIGAIGGIAGGAGLLAGAAKGIGKVGSIIKGGAKAIKTVAIDKVGTSAVNLVSGTTKDGRKLIQAQKQEARDALMKTNLADKLIKAGATPAEARAKAGLSLADVAGTFLQDKLYPGFDEATATGGTSATQPAGPVNKNLIYAGLGLAGLFILPKLFKI